MQKGNLKRLLMNHTRSSYHSYKTPACGKGQLQIPTWPHSLKVLPHTAPF